MRPIWTVPQETLDQLCQIDSCTVSNAIEQFDVRTRNEGFVNGSIRCVFPDLPPIVGYAVTASIRTSSTPVGGRCYYDRIDWWSYVRDMPGPRFLVIQDMDHMPGVGALFGEIHASIAVALGCVAYLTNGAVRDLPGIHASGLQSFAGSVTVSHSYAHVVEFGGPVEIGGLSIKPGDLLHGDQHGVVSIPQSIATEIPQVAEKILQTEMQLIQFCRSNGFSLDELSERIQRAAKTSGVPDKGTRL
jgi:4-hydroxy-4-methyl-2-oxoglutarate aldolase